MRNLLLAFTLSACSAAPIGPVDTDEPAPIPTRVAHQALPDAQDAGAESPLTQAPPEAPLPGPHDGWHLAHGGDCWLPDDPAAGGLCACSEGRPCTYDCGHYADGTPWVATQCCDADELAEGKRFPECG